MRSKNNLENFEFSKRTDLFQWNFEISEKTTFLWIKLQNSPQKNSLQWNLQFFKKIFLSIKSWTFFSYQISKFPNWDQKTFYETSNFREENTFLSINRRNFRNKNNISLNKTSNFPNRGQKKLSFVWNLKIRSDETSNFPKRYFSQ